MTARRLLAAAALAVALAHASPVAASQPVDGRNAEAATRRYDYPAAWVLPLVFVLATGWLARALTRDLNDE